MKICDPKYKNSDSGRALRKYFQESCTFACNFFCFRTVSERANKIHLSERTANIANSETNRPAGVSDESAADFADYFSSLGNPQEAALKLGIGPSDALGEGIRLMNDQRVRRLLKRKSGRDTRTEALAGLRRLAFGRINDALALLNDDRPFDPELLDLFNVSEIKKVKGGGVEIKFFDRLEALEKLAELEDKAADFASADNFFAALSKSVKRSEEEIEHVEL